MRAPDFWTRAEHPFARLLAPLGALYGALAAARLRQTAPRAALPAIVIGGLTTGGDGKTPLALAAAAALEKLGERPAFLTRGYGRRGASSRAPFLVDFAKHAARDVGDEALLLARAAPTIVGADRAAGARLAEKLGASIVILDDGLHSRRIAPDLALLAVDAGYGAGDGLCLPAGPLRAPLTAQIAAVDAIVLIGEGDAGETVAAQALAAGKLVLRARLAPRDGAPARLDHAAFGRNRPNADNVIDSKSLERALREKPVSTFSQRALSGERVVAFAGIARPQKFLRSLEELGATVVATRWFGDHHRFRATELSALTRDAARLKARLITTEKDAARIGGAAAVETLAVSLVVEEAEAFERLLRNAALTSSHP